MKCLAWIFTIVVVSLIFLVAAVAQAEPPRRIVVFEEFVNEPAREALVKASGGQTLKNLPLINGKAVLLPPQAEAVLVRIPGVVRIDPDVIVQALGQVLPWGVDTIDAELAWTTSTGWGVKVAIVDTGISTKHPDLKVYGGINTINPRKTYNDDNGHGSHVAGIVAALNNTVGVVGVAPAANLYAVKVLNAAGSGFLSDVIEGLDWCIKNGMKVVNMSLGTSSDVQSFHDAVIPVNNAGIIQVAAAGNASGGPVVYPAAYDEVIAVSATDNTNTIASFSSVGLQVELAAPGVKILSTYKSSSYATLSGTSMAAPHVTGSAALAIEEGVSDVRGRLQATADDLGAPGRDPLYGFGLVDADGAVLGTQPAPSRQPFAQGMPLTTTWASIKK